MSRPGSVVVAAVVVVACGSSSHVTSDGPDHVGDGPSGIDAPADAPVPIDAPCTSCVPLGTSWEHDYGGSGFGNTIEAVWVDAAGNTYVTGDFEGTIDFGNGPLTSAGLGDILVASYAPTGELRWADRFGGSMDDQGTAITVAAGKVYVGGEFTGAADLGSGTVTGAGREDAVWFVLDAATGALQSAAHVGTAGDDYVLGIAADAAGNITIAGVFAPGTLALGGSAITGSAGDNAFVASFTAAGAHRWSRTLAGSAPVLPATAAFDGAQAIVVDAAGDVTVAGEWMGTTDFGSGTITSSAAANMNFDGFVASYTSTGAPRWSRSFGSALGGFDGTSATVAGIDPGGNVVVGGVFHGTVDFGGTMLTEQGIVDGFALVLDGATGTTAMARSIGDTSRSSFTGIRFDSAGNVVAIGGMAAASTDLGNGVVLTGSGGEDDLFVAGFDRTTGAAQFGRRYGGPGLNTYVDGDALALSVHDSMAIGGTLAGPVDLGSGALNPGPDATGFVMLVTK